MILEGPLFFSSFSGAPENKTETMPKEIGDSCVHFEHSNTKPDATLDVDIIMYVVMFSVYYVSQQVRL